MNLTPEQDYQLVTQVSIALGTVDYHLQQLPPQDGIFIITAKPYYEYKAVPLEQPGAERVFKMATFANSYRNTEDKPLCLLALLVAVINSGGEGP